MKGVYKVTNTVTGWVYIGQSSILEKRYRQYCINKCDDLCTCISVSRNVKISILTYGRWNHEFEVIELVNDKEERLKREKYWIEYYDRKYPGLVLNIVMVCNPFLLRPPDNPVPLTKRLILKGNVIKPHLTTAEKKKDHYKNRWQGKEKSGNSLPRLPKPVYQIDLVTDEVVGEFESASIAGRATGVNIFNIASACNGKLRRAGDYKWKWK